MRKLLAIAFLIALAAGWVLWPDEIVGDAPTLKVLSEEMGRVITRVEMYHRQGKIHHLIVVGVNRRREVWYFDGRIER